MWRVTYFNSGVKYKDFTSNLFSLINELSQYGIYEWMVLNIESIPQEAYK